VHGNAHIKVMVNPDLVLAAAVALQVFVVLSTIDGLYIHLWRLRLHERPESYREHLWHTARAVLFAPVVAILFAMPSAGALLWLGVTLALADQVAGVYDALSERDSRRRLGGLGRGEYALHVVLVAVHATALTLVLAARPAAAWSLSVPTMVGEWPEVALLVGVPSIGGVVVAALHVALAWMYRPQVGCCAVKAA
jgi:hypothetical protein